MANKKHSNQTEKAILEAADKVFIRKGFAAARMEDIAQEANINRALLHYYFRSKDKMFDLIFEQRMAVFFSGLGQVMLSEKPLFEKIKAIIEHEMTMLLEHPYLPIFVLQELNQNPHRMLAMAENVGAHPHILIKKIATDVKAEVKAGSIRDVDPAQLFISIMGMAIYPFVARPVLKIILEKDDGGFEKVMRQRKKEITQFIIRALQV